MSRLSIFSEDSKIGGMYKSSLASLGFISGYIPSTKEMNEAYAQRSEDLSGSAMLEQLYINLQKPIYRYERVYERIQQQYLFKQYDILYKYYYLLEKEGLTKDSEKLLNSYEDEYERCLNNIRHIEVESNIVAGLITSGIDDDTLENFISGLEKRDLDEKFNIDNNQLSIKISDLKKKIKELYYEQSSKSRIDIKNECISKAKTIVDITRRFPSAERIITDYLGKQSATIIEDDIDLSKRRDHLSDVTFISKFLKHSHNGNPNTNKKELIAKLDGIKDKFAYILKKKRIDYMQLFKEKILTINHNNYLKNLTNYQIALDKLDDKNILFSTYTSIIGAMIDNGKLASEDIAYLDGLLNSFNNYLDGIKVSNKKVDDIDNVLVKEQAEVSSFCSFKERAINENIIYRYVNLRNQIISYYDQLCIPVVNRKNIYDIISNYRKMLQDSNVSLKEKLDAIDYLADYANTYCSDNTLQKSRPLA